MHVQYVCWAELLYIQLLTPQASFLGHLGGILAGLLHVHVLERLTLSGAGGLPGFRCVFISCTEPCCCVQQDPVQGKWRIALLHPMHALSHVRRVRAVCTLRMLVNDRMHRAIVKSACRRRKRCLTLDVAVNLSG